MPVPVGGKGSKPYAGFRRHRGFQTVCRVSDKIVYFTINLPLVQENFYTQSPPGVQKEPRKGRICTTGDDKAEVRWLTGLFPTV